MDAKYDSAFGVHLAFLLDGATFVAVVDFLLPNIPRIPLFFDEVGGAEDVFDGGALDATVEEAIS